MGPDDSFMIGVIITAATAFAVISIFGLLVQFLSLRMRNSALAEDARDPHLGRKFALSVFQHAGILLILAGLSVSMADVMHKAFTGTKTTTTPQTMAWGPNGPIRPGPGTPPTPPPFWDETQRRASGLMLSGVLHTVLFTMLLLFGTNARKFPAVGRAFTVNRLLLAGMSLITITTVFCTTLFKEDVMGLESFGRVIGLALVWGPTALGHYLWLMIGMAVEKERRKRTAAAEREQQREQEADRERDRERRRDRDDD